MPNKEILHNLLHRQDTWRGRNRPLRNRVVTTGFKDLNQLLLGGWPLSGLTELISPQDGIGEVSLLLPTIKHYVKQNTLCVWLNPPYQPNAQALLEADISLDQLLLVHTQNSREWLWAAEQIIRNNALLSAWTTDIEPNYAALRKLQLASSESLTPAFLFSPIKALNSPSPARLRMGLNSGKANILNVTLHKLKGKMPGAKTQIAFSNHQTERTPLNKLPVNIHYPEIPQPDYQIPKKDTLKRLNT